MSGSTLLSQPSSRATAPHNGKARAPAFSTTKARGAAATAADGDPPIDWRANLARYLESLPDDDDDDDDRGGARAAPAVDTK